MPRLLLPPILSYKPRCKPLFHEAAQTLHHGGIIAYPTEAVYGLGCDPLNPDSVLRLLALKQRDPNKGLILIASSFAQLSPLVQALDNTMMERITRTWPGPVTWLFPAESSTPWWLTGDHDTLAIRVTGHPVAAALCRAYAGPIVSTSANLSGQAPARNVTEVEQQFDHKLDTIVAGDCDTSAQPTAIYDAISGEQVRK